MKTLVGAAEPVPGPIFTLPFATTTTSALPPLQWAGDYTLTIPVVEAPRAARTPKANG